MTSNLVKKVIQGTALFTGLVVGAVGFSGCSTIYEKDPFVRQLVGGLPRVLQPGAYRDSIEKEEREKEREYQQSILEARERNAVNSYENKSVEIFIKGVDDGVRTSVVQDKKEAVLDAKKQAIEKAGVLINFNLTTKSSNLEKDLVEAKAEKVLKKGYNILDVGYVNDLYTVILEGSVKTGSRDEKKVIYKIPNKLSLKNSETEVRE